MKDEKRQQVTSDRMNVVIDLDEFQRLVEMYDIDLSNVKVEYQRAKPKLKLRDTRTKMTDVNGREVKRKLILRKEVNKEKYTVKNIPKSVQAYLDFWNIRRQGGGHKNGTKVFYDSVKMIRRLIRGVAFNESPLLEEYHDTRVDLTDFKTAVDNYCLAAWNHSFEPIGEEEKVKLRRVNLPNFILHPRTGKSMLIRYFNTPPRPIALNTVPTQDTHPEITNLIIKEYEKQIEQSISPSQFVRSKFIQASHRLFEFKEQMETDVPIQQLSKWLVESVFKHQDAESFKISVGWLCSDKTFEIRFPEYIKDRLVVKGKKAKLKVSSNLL